MTQNKTLTLTSNDTVKPTISGYNRTLLNITTEVNLSKLVLNFSTDGSQVYSIYADNNTRNVSYDDIDIKVVSGSLASAIFLIADEPNTALFKLTP